MMMRNIRLTAVLMMTAMISGQVTAEPVEGQSSRDTRVERTLIQQGAEAWGLTEQEYQRYESIMAGPRGTWSPNLDPLTALGLEARTQAERQKYAEQLVETERARVEAELAFQRAYDDAWQRLYPDAMPVEPFRMDEERPSSPFGSAIGATGGQRLNVVVAIDGCGQCEATVKRLLNSDAAMDIWVVDSNGDDDRIRSWAARVGIPPTTVRAGTVTLNHGGSLNVDSSELPRVAPRAE